LPLSLGCGPLFIVYSFNRRSGNPQEILPMKFDFFSLSQRASIEVPRGLVKLPPSCWLGLLLIGLARLHQQT
jgi:hypothetical protein